MSEYIIQFMQTGGGANPGGDGWGGGVIPTDTNRAITVYAWDKDPSVTFNTINQTVEVDPRSYSEDTAGAQQAADDFGAQVTALQGSGFKGAFRYWNPDGFGSQAFLDGNWWESMDPYDAIPVDSTFSSWWSDFNARVTSNGVVPDYLILDEEENISYFKLPDESTRRSFFEPITINDANNPYPDSPNPYIGESIWSYSAPLTDQFLQEWNQDALEKMNDYLATITTGCPVASVDGNSNVSNYNDYLQSYEIGNLRNRPDRLPEAQDRLSDISSVPCYIDFSTDESLTDPESEFSSTRQAINRRRWKKMIWRLNKVRTSLAAGSRTHPWIAPPGYGWNGADTWATATVLPFEKMLWRLKMRHLRALGLDTFLLWNPDSNPNAADTDTFMDVYFTDLMVRDVPSKIGATSISADVIVTNDRVTAYDDVYRIRGLYTQRATSPIEPFSQGFGTAAEPLIINTGATGDAELADFLAALEVVYGDETTGGEDSYQVPSEYKISGAIPAPE